MDCVVELPKPHDRRQREEDEGEHAGTALLILFGLYQLLVCALDIDDSLFGILLDYRKKSEMKRIAYLLITVMSSCLSAS